MKRELGSPSSLPNIKGVRPGCWRAAWGKRKRFLRRWWTPHQDGILFQGVQVLQLPQVLQRSRAAVVMRRGADSAFLDGTRHCGLPSRMAVVLWHKRSGENMLGKPRRLLLLRGIPSGGAAWCREHGMILAWVSLCPIPIVLLMNHQLAQVE